MRHIVSSEVGVTIKPQRILLAYYMATAVFLILDLVADINVRIAFFESVPALRWGYYGVCFTCLALMMWQPAWTVIISAFESLVTLVALILAMGLRTMLITDAILEGYEGFVTFEEIINFMISGSVAYFAWVRGMQELRDRV